MFFPFLTQVIPPSLLRLFLLGVVVAEDQDVVVVVRMSLNQNQQTRTSWLFCLQLAKRWLLRVMMMTLHKS